MEQSEAIKILSQYDVNFYWTDGEPVPWDKLAEALGRRIIRLMHIIGIRPAMWRSSVK